MNTLIIIAAVLISLAIGIILGMTIRKKIAELYTGRMIEKIKFDKEILEKYFSEEKEETIFIDDVVYFTIEY